MGKQHLDLLALPSRSPASLVLNPAARLHLVSEVTAGQRLAVVGWVEE